MLCRGVGNKHAYQREKIKASKKGDNKEAVIGIVQRRGKAMLKHVGKATHANTQNEVYKVVKGGSILVTDGSDIYADLCKHYNHYSVNHSNDEYVGYSSEIGHG
jgi:hypothetical protein